MLSVASSAAIISKVILFIEQFKNEAGKALYKLRREPTTKDEKQDGIVELPFKNEKPITVISIPGVNAQYGAEYLKTKDNAAIWFKLFINMWATVLGAAVESGSKILCAPMISGGAFAPKDGKVEFLICNFLALGLLLATVFKGKFDRIYLNPVYGIPVNKTAWDVVFGEDSPLKAVLNSNGGSLVRYSQDVAFLAVELGKNSYDVALLNPSDADVTFGLMPLGQYILMLSPNPDESDMVGEESYGLYSTMPLVSRGLGMFRKGSKVVSLYESPDKIKLLAQETFDIIKNLIRKFEPTIMGITTSKAFDEQTNMLISTVVLSGVRYFQAGIGLETTPGRLTTLPIDAAQAFGLTEKDARERATISNERAKKAMALPETTKTSPRSLKPQPKPTVARPIDEDLEDFTNYQDYGFTAQEAAGLEAVVTRKEAARTPARTSLSSPQTASTARRTSYGPPSSPSSTSSPAVKNPRGRAVTTITTQFVDDQPPAAASYGSVEPLGAVEDMDDVQPFGPAPRAQAVGAY